MKEFEQNHPEKNIATPFGNNDFEAKNPEREKDERIKKEIDFSRQLPERKEETGYRSALRADLAEMQKGGTDLHFGQIDIDKLDTKTLDFYGKYKKKQADEQEIKDFMHETMSGSDDYNFLAMLLNWKIGENYNNKKGKS